MHWCLKVGIPFSVRQEFHFRCVTGLRDRTHPLIILHSKGSSRQFVDMDECCGHGAAQSADLSDAGRRADENVWLVENNGAHSPNVRESARKHRFFGTFGTPSQISVLCGCVVVSILASCFPRAEAASTWAPVHRPATKATMRQTSWSGSAMVQDIATKTR